MNIVTKPLAPWIWPAAFLILGMVAIATLGNLATNWLEQRQQASKLDDLQQQLGTTKLELQATSSALATERSTTATLKRALDDELKAQQEAEKRHLALNEAFTELQGAMEALENEQPDVKAWADAPVPLAVQRLHREARDRYRGKDYHANSAAPGQPDASLPATGAERPIGNEPGH